MSSTTYLGGWQTLATVGICTTIAANLVVKLVRKTVLVPSLTIMNDLPNAGKDRPDGLRKGRAVICGGSVAGLLTAAVCAQHFENVLVIEPEGSVEELGMDIPKDKETRMMENGLTTAIPLRKRVVQYLTLHVFLPIVLLGLRQLFPELQKELDYFGLAGVPMTVQFFYGSIPSPELYRPDDPNAPKTLPISRQALETLLRRLVVKYRNNITFLTGTVEGFQRTEDGSNKISGVKVRTAGGVKQEESGIFVVDATGPAQSSYHKWIKNAGFGPLPSSLQISYDPFLTYSQSVWTLSEKVREQVKDLLPYGLHPGVVYANTPDWSTGEQKAMYIDLVEKSQLLITTGGWDLTADQRPHSIDELRAYLKSIHRSETTPDWVYGLLDILEANEEACAPWWVEVPAGRMSYIKYQEAPKGTLPDNWIAVGDAFLKLNPIYGQGCTKAMMDAITLDGLLRQLPSNQAIPLDFSGKFFRKAIARSGSMWDGTKAVDYGWPTTEPAKGETLREGAFGRNLGRSLIYAGRTVRQWANISSAIMSSNLKPKNARNGRADTLRSSFNTPHGVWLPKRISSRHQCWGGSRGVG
ncbi:hypothetical protein FRB93_001988 [Tulasnella sp. JGI-2019a]|nr:hypothetical protein FRB93_001988 [Tulasnella sp. JGI-2019a]